MANCLVSSVDPVSAMIKLFVIELKEVRHLVMFDLSFFVIMQTVISEFLGRIVGVKDGKALVVGLACMILAKVYSAQG